MAEYCSACESLKEYAPNFVVNGVTDKECKSLQNDTGLNPGLKVLHNNCEDLNDMLDCLLGALYDKLPAFDSCDWKKFIEELMPNLLNMQKAMICSECGQWKKIHDLEDAINKIWIKLGKVEKAIDDLAAQNWEVNSRYVIEYSTPGMSVSVDRASGDFTFKWSDWLDGTFTKRLGRGTLTGKVIFGMGADNGLDAKWQIRSVLVSNISYISDAVSDVNTFRINVYVKNNSEQVVYQRTHNSMSNFSDSINKTISLGVKGVLSSGTNSGWIQFLEVFNEIVNGSLNDRANVQVQFVNNNKSSVPPYI